MTTELLQVHNLKQYFPIKGGIFGRKINDVKAVDDITFAINEGETLSIVGESGCGKSTTGRAILRLDEPTSGEVTFDGEDLLSLNKKEMQKKRKDLQIIFQDPYASINPRQTVRQVLNEAMEIQNVLPKEERYDRMIELLETVGLGPDKLDRFPHEFSGGQRQRIGIARALAVDPKMIVCDESVSALDVSVQAQVLNLLQKLQKDLNLTYLFISHDLGVVRHISDRVLVMYLGKIVEIADKKSLFDNPKHPYTKTLLSAIPVPDPNAKKEQIVLKGDVPSPIDPPTGCRFHTRCPFATDRCKEEVPELRQNENLMGEQHQAACHYIEEIESGEMQPKY
ncbi:ABC transporter ATP-binding protein [Texcoconibacillus texcoconensis]|uniref:Peptide/nickel transport system ATP-binding protein/oligopeptide transport system ATP-binding protein n=1 Tax=Texcoconibacillus texcoconensis TaxID=1095777 RepID=A0A840QP73_9BACI|nr:dipeptide ABC transporter ATP-binding protein [Texcoconibacillus texcoconensis]MBB5173141.1 peptide/nickel transport system ATP-binding protein/oligopeptide transport system ATP-binding protein [Texcoconibacillus texcoconensis]